MKSKFEIIDYTIIIISNTNDIDEDKELEKKKNKIVNYWNSFKRVFEQYFDNFISYLSMKEFSLENFINKCQDSSHSTSLSEKIAYIESDFNKIINLFPVENYETLYKFKDEKIAELFIARGQRTELRSILQTYNATYQHFDESFKSDEYLEGLKKLSDEEDENTKKKALDEIEKLEPSLKDYCDKLNKCFELKLENLKTSYNNNYEYIKTLKKYLPNFEFSNDFDFEREKFINEYKKSKTYNDKDIKIVKQNVEKYYENCLLLKASTKVDNEIQSTISNIITLKKGIKYYSPYYIFYDARDYNHDECIKKINEYWSESKSYNSQKDKVEPHIQKFIDKNEEVKRREKHYELLEIIISFIKNKTFISIDKSFKYLNVEQLITEKNRQENWHEKMILAAILFFILAIIIVSCNLCSLTNTKIYYNDSIIDTNNNITRIIKYGNSDTNIIKQFKISYNLADSIQKKEAINFVQKELSKDELVDNDILAVIYKSILTLTCLSLMILSLNQASRARKTMLILAKEINEFKYIEGLLKAKNEVDFDRSTNETISKAINALIKNHLDIQKNRITNEDSKIDEDLSTKTVETAKDVTYKFADNSKQYFN